MCCRWECVLWPLRGVSQHKGHLTEDLCHFSFPVWDLGLSVSVWWPAGIFFFSTILCTPTKCGKAIRLPTGLNLWPAKRFSCDPPGVWESLVEGLMVIWSTLLNELTQPLADVQCDTSVVSSDPWVCTDYEWGGNNRTLSGLGHARINQTSLFEHERRVFVPQQLLHLKT